MKINFQLTACAILLGASGISQAALTSTSGPVSFNGTATVTASQSYPNTPAGTGPLNVTNTNNGASVASVALGKFDAATGVLTGVELQATSNRNQTISGTGNKGNGAGKTMSGSGTSSAAITASGAALNFSPAISQTGSSCTLATGGTGPISCAWGPTASSTATNGSTGVNSANLDDYVGSSGTVNATLTLPSLSVTDTQSTNQGQASGSSATYSVNWAGDLQANYNYLLHALASFDGSSASSAITLDFGNVALNSSSSALAFNLFNHADTNRIGLDLDSVVGSGNTSAFSTDLAAFSGMAQGSSHVFLANLLTSTAGNFNAQYLLNLSDADVGASSTRQAYQLTLNLVGNVSAVPVPGAVWSFLTGMMGLLALGRRKKAI